MNKIVLELLKPRVKALGFSKDELESIAADIADNLELKEDASEEEKNAAAKSAVDAVIPSLKFAQRMANRSIENYRKKVAEEQSKKEEEEKKAAEEKARLEAEEAERKRLEEEARKNHSTSKETPEWAQALLDATKKVQEDSQKYQEEVRKSQALIQSLQSELNGMKGERKTQERKVVLEELLKDTGTFGSRILKNFEKMKFDSQEDFDAYVSEIKDDLAQLNQEREDAGLEKLGMVKVPPTKTEHKPEVKELTEAELEELAQNM